MKKIVLAADLGGTNLRMAVVNQDGEILARVKQPTPRSTGPEKIVASIVKAAGKSIRKVPGVTPLAVTVAVPATLDYSTGTTISVPNLPELEQVALQSEIEKEFKLPSIIENDANAAALGENWLGSSAGYLNSIMVTLGTGVGGGIIIDGKLLRGPDGSAGEIGHICVVEDGVRCGCRSYGCVEQYASASAIVRGAKETLSESELAGLEADTEFNSADIYHLARAGSEAALNLFRIQGKYLGIVLAGLVNTLNPEVIVIGGGASAGWDLFLPQTKEQIRIRAYRKPRERAKLVRAILGDDAGILGSAKLGFDFIEAEG